MTGRAIVCGAGVVGLACAFALSERGWTVEVAAPDTDAPSASMVAAGMLAPAAEALTDDLAPPYALAAAALNAWRSFGERAGLSDLVVRCGTLWPEPALHPRLEARAERLRIALRRTPEGLLAPEDARIEVAAALSRLRRALTERGVRFRSATVVQTTATGVRLGSGESLDADRVALAAGWATHGLAAGIPLLRCLEPVGGQLVRFAPGPGSGDGPMIRGAGGYLCPSAEGVAAGGSMEPGRVRDTADPSAAEAQAALARRWRGDLVPLPYRALAGTRATTPDGQPLVGPTPEGVLLAAGLRRNGWLLAPLVGQTIARAAAGEAPEPWAEAWAPTRVFSPTP